MTPSLDPEGFQGLAGFRYALRQFLAEAEAISRAAGVTQSQYQALLAIRAWPGGAMTVGDLADQLLMSHHAAVQLVNRLEKARLASRSPSPSDRRRVELRLTPQGLEVVETLAGQHLREVLRQAPLLTKSLQRVRKMSRTKGAA
jgi:DNA-binding MarR family transcriptional regulator